MDIDSASENELYLLAAMSHNVRSEGSEYEVALRLSTRHFDLSSWNTYQRKVTVRRAG